MSFFLEVVLCKYHITITNEIIIACDWFNWFDSLIKRGFLTRMLYS